MTFTLRSRRVVLPGGVRPAGVVVAEGEVAAVVAHGDPRGDVVDAGDSVVMPGLVDSHVHVNEPGRTEWEGFATATAAAAAGGTTTIVDMPLNSVPPTVDPAALAAKLAAAAGRCHVDVAFWGGVVPGNLGELRALAAAGVCGFKAFLVDSGVPEFPAVGMEELEAALRVLAELGLPLIVHAELAAPMSAAQARFEALAPEARRDYAAYLASRPPAGEDDAVAALVELAARHEASVHVLHLASGSALPAVAEARRSGLAVSAETCPHYLMFAAADVPAGATAFKCAPPIREVEHREALWAGLAGGSIGLVVSDHSPAPAELKATGTGDFGEAWGGISSLQLRLPVTWTAAAERGVGLEDLAEWLSAAPARLAGLDGRKGAIRPGADADLVVWDPEAEFKVDAAALQHRHPVTPYSGMRLRGVVRATYLRGRLAAAGAPASGQLLARPY